MSYSIPMTFEASMKLVTDLIKVNGLSKSTTVDVKDGRAILKVNKFGHSKITFWYKELDNKTTFGVQSKELSMLHRKTWGKLEKTLADLVRKHGGHICG